MTVNPQLNDALRERYVLERELGRGGMATVYLARDLKHDRFVALKVMLPELAAYVGPERFLREVRTTARLDHPHILPVLDSGEAAGLLWYTMPYVRGESLRERLRREIQLPVEVGVEFARQVASALDYAHRQGVLHRDLKPDNILLADGQARVADFGVAKALEAADDGQLTETGLALGTPTYMSPEQASGGNVDGRSDIYALGCVLYEMLAGEPPYTGPTPQAITVKRFTDPIPSVRRVREGVSESLENSLQRALAKVPADRFPTAAEFAHALSTLDNPVRTTGHSSRIAPESSISSRRLTSSAATALVVLVLLGAGFLFWRSHSYNSVATDNVLAVAPFDVLSPELQLWREGLVDVVSRNLDGAGALRTVSPTVVIRRWAGRADPASAAELAEATGAGLVVFGRLLPAGRDSVRLAAGLLRAKPRAILGEVEFRQSLEHVDRLADSLSVALLRMLAGGRSSGIPGFSSLGTNSLPALKQYLQAEQYYRQGHWDSAASAAERAVAVDSTFALAWRRLGWALGWRDWEQGVFQKHFITAGTYNEGLAPRDSLVVAIDAGLAGSTPVALLSKLTDEGVERYPDDPELWYLKGEFESHRGFTLGIDATTNIEAFKRSIALDTAFTPAYLHPVGLHAALGHTQEALQTARKVFAIEPNSPLHRLLVLVLDPTMSQSSELTQVMDSAQPGILATAYGVLMAWPDTLVIRLARKWTERWQEVRPGKSELPWLAYSLASRGRLREAARASPSVPAYHLLTFKVLGEEAAIREAKQAVQAGAIGPAHLAWWGERGDTAALRVAARLADSLAQGQDLFMEFVARAARAHYLLAAEDTAAALNAFMALPDSQCSWEECLETQRVTARLLTLRGRDNDALLALNKAVIHGDLWAPAAIAALLERAEIAERVGRRDLAQQWYHYVLRAWGGADLELAPLVGRARRGARRVEAPVATNVH